VCLGGQKDGYECSSDIDCDDDGDPETPSTSICAAQSQLDTYYGWEGYCLEKDTSIQIFGSAEEEDRACLTWLPVDQLVGSTDLYGKYTQAGYDAGDTYYCADISASYSLRSTASPDGTGIACAETLVICNDRSWSNFKTHAETYGDCLTTAFCPNGYFAVMTGCGNEGYSADGTSDFCTTGHPDCDYFCVPKGSIHTDTGEACLEPEDELGSTIEGSYTVSGGMVNGLLRPDWEEDGTSFKIFLVQDSSFGELLEIYDDCWVRGVTTHLDDFLEPFGDYPRTSWGGTDGYYDLHIADAVEMDAACTTVVQVAEDDGNQNKAWTDRVWTSAKSYGTEFYTIEDTGGLFNYPVSLEHAVFGKMGMGLDTSGTDGDGQPAMTIACKSDTGDIRDPHEDGTCPEGEDDLEYDITSTDGDDAWPYLEMSTARGYFLDTTSYCSLVDCACTEANIGEDCNGEEGVAPVCSGGVCDIGPLAGEGCEDDEGCYLYGCVVSGEECTMSSGMETCYDIYACGLETEDVVSTPTETATDALSRLAQIFGASYDIYLFTDGYEGIDDMTLSEAASLSHYGKYEVSTSANWIWDLVRGDDDSYTTYNPEPPVVISVGDCSGSVCEEGEEDAFSINEQDQGEVRGANGNLHVTARFYVAADMDQMPVRKILVDWANDASHFGSYSGSTADDNFYKNHRGVLDISDPESQCASDASTWDLYSDACDNSYVAFTKDYVCTEGIVAGLESCEQDEDGNVTNSPCKNTEGACVFRPRVFVQDNWGWCTGVCEAGLDGESGCYEDISGDTDSKNECDWENCPGGTRCGSSDGEIDPWVYFDGEIVVEP
jgi:hypothetical protein